MEQAAEALVVDASVAVYWHLLDEEHAQEAALLRWFMRGAIDLISRYNSKSQLLQPLGLVGSLQCRIGVPPMLLHHAHYH
jgi:hypothetical protein